MVKLRIYPPPPSSFSKVSNCSNFPEWNQNSIFSFTILIAYYFPHYLPINCCSSSFNYNFFYHHHHHHFNPKYPVLSTISPQFDPTPFHYFSYLYYQILIIFPKDSISSAILISFYYYYHHRYLNFPINHPLPPISYSYQYYYYATPKDQIFYFPSQVSPISIINLLIFFGCQKYWKIIDHYFFYYHYYYYLNHPTLPINHLNFIFIFNFIILHQISNYLLQGWKHFKKPNWTTCSYYYYQIITNYLPKNHYYYYSKSVIKIQKN